MNYCTCLLWWIGHSVYCVTSNDGETIIKDGQLIVAHLVTLEWLTPSWIIEKYKNKYITSIGKITTYSAISDK